MPRVMLRTGSMNIPVPARGTRLYWQVSPFHMVKNWVVRVIFTTPSGAVGVSLRARIDQWIRLSSGFDRSEYDLTRVFSTQVTRSSATALVYIAEFRVRRDKTPSASTRLQLVNCLSRDLRRLLVGLPLPTVHWSHGVTQTLKV